MSHGARNCPFLTLTTLPVAAAASNRSVCRHRNAGICSTSTACATSVHCAASWMSVSTGRPRGERITANTGCACARPMPRAVDTLVRLALSNEVLYTRPTLRRVAISFSAQATSSACARLSSWHGPAMIEIGKSLPNLTDPAVTTGAAEMLAFKAFFLRLRIGPCRAAATGSTHFGRFEYQGCAMGDVRRHDQPPDMALRRDRVLPQQGFDLRQVGDRKAHRIQCHPLPAYIGHGAELVAKGDRRHHLDVAVLGARGDAERARMQVADAGEGFQKDMMIGRIVGNHHNGRDSDRAVGVALKVRIPEVLRIMLLANGKAEIGRRRIAGKSERERDLHL